MPRIVSGMPEFEDPGLAYLRGYKGSREQQQQDAAEQRRNMAAMLDFMQAQAENQREETKALQKAQQGQVDAKALAAWGALAQRAKMNPRAAARLKRAQSAGGALQTLASRGVSDDAIQRILGHVKDAEDAIVRQEASQDFDEALQAAQKDQIITPEDALLYGTRKAAGEPLPKMLGELQEARGKRRVLMETMQANADGFQRAQAALQAAPPGRQRDLAAALVKEYEMSPSMQEKPGAGAGLLQQVTQTLIGSIEQYEEAKELAEARRKAMFTTVPMPGLGATTGAQMRAELAGDDVPEIGGDVTTIPSGKGSLMGVPVAHRTVQGGKARKMSPTHLRKTIQPLFNQTSSLPELVQALEAQGIELTDDVQALVRKYLLDRKSRAHAQAGADR